MSSLDIDIKDFNRNLPFFPNRSYILQSSDYDNLNVPAFNWIQAFYATSSLANPVIAVWGGIILDDVNHTKQVNIIRFAYSGQMIPFHGRGILTSGIDMRGQTITSATIGSGGSQFSQIICYGGVGGGL